MTVAELCAALGERSRIPDGHSDDWAVVMRLLVGRYGATPAADFGLLAMISLRQVWADDGLHRSTIAARVSKLRRVFRCGVSRQLVSPTLLPRYRQSKD